MATLETIRLLTVRGRAEGLDSLTAAMERVKAAYSGTAAGAAEAGTATETSARKTLSSTQAWDRLQARVDPVAGAMQRIAREIGIADKALATGVISASRYADEIERIKRSVESAGTFGPRVDQSAINSFVGVRPSADGDARASAQAFEREFARIDAAAASLRAQLDPTSAAQSKMNAEIAEYRSLAAAGAITTDELAAAVTQAETRFEAATGAIRRMAEAQNLAATSARTQSGQAGWQRLSAAGGDNLQVIERQNAFAAANARAATMLSSLGQAGATAAGGVKLATNQMANMSYQLNDIAVSLASGQSPFIVMTQQGMQMAQIFGPGVGVRGALSAIGGAIASFVTNPLTLAVGGFAAVAAAASYFFSSSSSGIDKVEQNFKAHAATVASLKGLYGDVAKSLQEYANESERVVRFKAQSNIDNLTKQLKEQTTAMIAALGQTIDTGATGQVFSVNVQFEPFRAQIIKLREDLDAGRHDVDGFREAILKIVEMNPENSRLRAAAEAVLEIGKAASDTAGRLPAAKQMLDALTASAAGGIGALTSYGDAMRGIASFVPELAKQQKQVDDLNKVAEQAATAKQRIREQGYSEGTQASYFSTIDANTKRAREAILGLTDAQEKATKSNADYVRSRQIGALNPRDQAIARENDAYRDQIALLKEGQSSQSEFDKAKTAHAEAMATIGRSYGEDGRKVRQGGGGKSDFDREFERAQERIRDAEAEIATIGKADSAVEAYRMKQELLAAAQEKGGAVSATQRAQIDQLANSYGALKQRAAEAQLVQELSNDRADVFLDDVGRRIAAAQRETGVDADSAFGRYIENTMRMTDELQRMGETGREAFKTVMQSLREGESFSKSIGKAAGVAGNRLLDQAADQAYDFLWSSFGQATGLGALLGPAGGKRDGSTAAAALFVQMATPMGAGLLGGAANDNGFAGGIADALGSMFNFNPFAFAGGGIMTSRGPVPLRTYSAGGIANSPQVAMFGEGSTPEAYVPVPSGRIPVEMRGAAKQAREQVAVANSTTTVTFAPTITIGANAGVSEAQVRQVVRAENERAMSEFLKSQELSARIAAGRNDVRRRRVA